jgi:hypothetical protein
MKKLLLFIALTFTLTIVSGQKSVDALFERYSGRDGFVTVSISGNLLRLAHLEDNNRDNSLPANITAIRILAREDDNMKKIDNFYDQVIKDLNLNDYEEFMSVKKSDQDLRMLVRTDGNIFREFLLIAGGEDNALIQIKGNMTLREAKRFSEDAKKNHCTNLVADHK